MTSTKNQEVSVVNNTNTILYLLINHDEQLRL